MEKEKSFFVKLYKRDGKIVAHEVSETKGEFRGIDSETTSKQEAGRANDKFLDRSIDQFHQTMLVHLDFMPLLLDLAPALSSDASVEALEAFLEKVATKKHKCEDGKIYEIHSSAAARLTRFSEAMTPLFNVQDTLARSVIVGIVASLDALIGNLIKSVCLARPELAVTGEETIKAKEVMKFNSLDEFKENLIAREVDDQSQGGLDSQVGWLCKKLALDDISKNYNNWKILGEVFQRRHVFVHSNGLASAKYILNAEKFGYDLTSVAVGTELRVGPKYVFAAMQCVFEFGIMLANIVQAKLPNYNADDSLSYLNQLCFELLQRGDYELARELLEFASKLRGNVKASTRLMVAVNLANAHKLLGDVDIAERILNEQDWSNVGLEYVVCRDALFGDVDLVVAAMGRAAFKEFFTETHCQEWPVFFHVRDDVRFIEAFKLAFNQDFKPRSKKMNSVAELAGMIEAGGGTLALKRKRKRKSQKKSGSLPRNGAEEQIH